jgi:hypothetical protein
MTNGLEAAAQQHTSYPRPAGVECAKCKTYPATSRVISLTKAVLFDRKPFLREILGAGVLGVTSVGALSVSIARAGGKFVVGVRTVASVEANDEACERLALRDRGL